MIELINGWGLYLAASYTEVLFWVQEKGAVHLASSDNMYKVKHELKHASKSYCMEYYFKTKKKGFLCKKFLLMVGYLDCLLS